MDTSRFCLFSKWSDSRGARVSLPSAFVAVFVAAFGVACAGEPRPVDEATGVATVAISLAPPDVQCLVITVAGNTTVTRSVALAPESNTVFLLDGLPLGIDTFSANAYAASCASLDGGAAPSWFSDSVTATVVGSPPVPVTLTMQQTPAPQPDAGGALVAVEFPDAEATTNANAITEFSLAATAAPKGITAGPDGNLWFAESGGNNSIGRVTPAGVITEFALPTAAAAPSDIAAGPDGNLWFTEESASQIGRITPSGAITEFAVPTSSLLRGMAAGPDGNMWFTEVTAAQIGRITPAGLVTEFPTPTAGSFPQLISGGPDSALWFAEASPGGIGRVTTDGVISEFPVPVGTGAPFAVTPGPDGNVWISGVETGIASVDGNGSLLHIFAVPGLVRGMTSGPDGNLWLTASDLGAVVRVSLAGVMDPSTTPVAPASPAVAPSTTPVAPATPRVEQFAIAPAGSDPWGIASGPDGNVWFTVVNSNTIGRIAP